MISIKIIELEENAPHACLPYRMDKHWCVLCDLNQIFYETYLWFGRMMYPTERIRQQIDLEF